VIGGLGSGRPIPDAIRASEVYAPGARVIATGGIDRDRSAQLSRERSSLTPQGARMMAVWCREAARPKPTRRPTSNRPFHGAFVFPGQTGALGLPASRNANVMCSGLLSRHCKRDEVTPWTMPRSAQ
jgi:hypothetical protein